MELLLDTVETELGQILIVSDGKDLCALDYEGYQPRMHALLRSRCGNFRLERRTDPNGFSTRLRAYLAGDLAAIETIPVATGGTAFQRQVWTALRRIPAGSTMTYGALATRLGRPAAARAVGHANSLNPVAIVVPCHRLVGSSGKLTGYAGGLPRKQWLITHERIHAGDAPAALRP